MGVNALLPRNDLNASGPFVKGLQMIKTILILADETPAFEMALASAVELGRTFGAHLDVLHVRSDPIDYLPLAGEGLSALMIEEIKKAAEKALRARERKARAAYDRLLAETGVSARWRVAIGGKPEIAAAAARLSDLVLVARPDDSDENSWRKTLEAVLFGGGRPVLLLARKSLPIFGARAAIGWNGSAQAARAVTAALPFLRLAERTTILSAGAVGNYASPGGLVALTCRCYCAFVWRQLPAAKPKMMTPSERPPPERLRFKRRSVGGWPSAARPPDRRASA